MFGCVGYCLFGGFGVLVLVFLDYGWCRFVWMFVVAGLWWIAFVLLDILFSFWLSLIVSLLPVLFWWLYVLC